MENSVKMVVPERIKLTVSDKKGNRFIAIGLEKDLPDGIGFEAVAEALYQKTANFIDQKFALIPDQPEPQPIRSAPQGSNLGVCKDCGAPRKLSQNGKPYCSALCWKKGNNNRNFTDIPF